ncbi:MAG: hypothetical protein H8D23_37915 [Candidatus Brocadiales bacterium]|nr:hypothetical protein [Candidatus Brocadiales bacterium]
MDKQSSLILIGLVAIFSSVYFYISTPDKVVVDQFGKVNGVINKYRELLQGEKFWIDQIKEVKSAISWHSNARDRSEQIHQIFQKSDDRNELKNKKNMELLYEKYPEYRPSIEAQLAEQLRRQADELERQDQMAQLDRISQKKVHELRRVLTAINSLHD